MKKMNRHVALSAGLLLGLAFSACSKDEPTNDGMTYDLRVLTFEDKDYKTAPYTLQYCKTEVKTWSDLIAKLQVNDVMLYGKEQYPDTPNAPYEWKDDDNTYLSHKFCSGMYGTDYSSGGHAISNYADLQLEYADYTKQLTVYSKDAKTGFGGHNGSKNFCVHFGCLSPYSTEIPGLEFMDGISRVIDHMWVTSTTFAMNVYKNGGNPARAIGEGDWVKIIAIGYDAEMKETGRTEFYLADGPDKLVDKWTKWDLSVLGAVKMVKFNIDSTDKGDFGVNQPAYFAYDDVAVRFER